ncbi:hypothetical protein [Flavobacterium sp.]|uniref:hypothetical protein n=1 Tax=Flavobacterium sp. TaxID=239 RepID=UPI00262BAE7E|nr:hypothetical protein [Flavobacterium sp.]
MIKKGVTIGPKDTDLKSTDKTDILEYNIEEIRGWTIDELNKIEDKINTIITRYFAPEKELEFRTIILNSSIVSTGAKMKILRNIESFDKKYIGKIQTLMNTRNAFAHLPLTKSAVVSVTNNNGNLVWLLESVTSQLDIMNSSGEIKKKNAKELVLEYKDLVVEINQYLDEYIPPMTKEEVIKSIAERNEKK